MKGVGRLTQKEHRRSTTVKPDIQKEASRLSLSGAVHVAVSVAAQGWISPLHLLAVRTCQFPFTFNSLPTPP